MKNVLLLRDPSNTLIFKIFNEMNELELMGVQEMDAMEMVLVDGGWSWVGFLVGAIGGAGIGAGIGSVFEPVGTIVGAVVGAGTGGTVGALIP